MGKLIASGAFTSGGFLVDLCSSWSGFGVMALAAAALFFMYHFEWGEHVSF